MKIAVFGGAFNPIHNGHLKIAQYIKNNSIAEEVLFIPSHKNSKDSLKTINDEHRINMIKLVLQDYSYCSFSDIEITKKAPSYTYETLETLSSYYSKISIVFIMGMDNLYDIQNWYNYKSIIREYPIITFCRPPHKKILPVQLKPYLEKPLIEKIFKNLIEESNHIFSSRQIRENFQNHNDIKDTVPQKVYEYIQTNQLYNKKNYEK